MNEPPDGDRTPIVTPQPITAALAITAAGTLVLGVLPGLVMRFADLQDLTGAARPLMAAAGRAATTSGPPSPRPAGRSRSRRSWTSPSTGRTASTPSTPAAGRRGDFLTSPEVGPLFGAVVARYLDARVGPARPARPVHGRRRRRRPGHAGPRRARRRAGVRVGACATSPSRSSAAQRARHPAGVESRARPCRTEPIDGVVLANELLDNLPFRLAVFDGGWREAFVAARPDGTFAEVLSAPFDPVPGGAAGPGAPRRAGAAAGGRGATGSRRRARVRAPAGRSWWSTTPDRARPSWRCCRGGRGCGRTGGTSGGRTRSPTRATQDITADVAVDQLPEPDAVRSQAQFLQLHGIAELVDEGRAAWAAAAAQPDLRGAGDAQPGRRGGGAARPGRASAASPSSSGAERFLDDDRRAIDGRQAGVGSAGRSEEVEWSSPAIGARSRTARNTTAAAEARRRAAAPEPRRRWPRVRDRRRPRARRRRRPRRLDGPAATTGSTRSSREEERFPTPTTLPPPTTAPPPTTRRRRRRPPPRRRPRPPTPPVVAPPPTTPPTVPPTTSTPPTTTVPAVVPPPTTDAVLPGEPPPSTAPDPTIPLPPDDPEYIARLVPSLAGFAEHLSTPELAKAQIDQLLATGRHDVAVARPGGVDLRRRADGPAARRPRPLGARRAPDRLDRPRAARRARLRRVPHRRRRGRSTRRPTSTSPPTPTATSRPPAASSSAPSASTSSFVNDGDGRRLRDPHRPERHPLLRGLRVRRARRSPSAPTVALPVAAVEQDVEAVGCDDDGAGVVLLRPRPRRQSLAPCTVLPSGPIGRSMDTVGPKVGP